MKIGILSSLASTTGCSLRGEYLASALEKQGNEVYYFPRLPQLKYKLDYLLFIPYNILRTFNKKFDFLIVLKPFPTGCIPAIINRFFTKTKIIIDIDDLDYTYRTGILAKIIENMQKSLSKHFDLATILDNKNLIDYISKKWKIKHMIPIEQGVDADLFNPDKYNKNNLRKKYSLTNKKVIVFTGHLGETAVEVEMLLNSFKDISKKEDKAFLVIAGGGSKLEFFKNLANSLGIEKNVLFTGYLKNTEMPKFVSLADVCVCYYEDRKANYYRNSMKVREYLSMGKLVVCTNVADLKKFKDFTIQTKPNKNDFVNGILKSLNKKENKSIESKRRKSILNNFSWDKIANKLSKELIKTSKPQLKYKDNFSN